jgi:hypothetical protein
LYFFHFSIICLLALLFAFISSVQAQAQNNRQGWKRTALECQVATEFINIFVIYGQAAAGRQTLMRRSGEMEVMEKATDFGR